MEQGERRLREDLERLLEEHCPEGHAAIAAMPEGTRAEIYDRLGRGLRASVERAVLYGTRS